MTDFTPKQRAAYAEALADMAHTKDDDGYLFNVELVTGMATFVSTAVPLSEVKEWDRELEALQHAMRDKIPCAVIALLRDRMAKWGPTP